VRYKQGKYSEPRNNFPVYERKKKKKEKTTIWTVAKAISNQFSAMPHRDLLFLTDPSNLISNVSSFLFVLGSHP
jgi:hypothetical protein